MKKPYTITAYIPVKGGNPAEFLTELNLQTAAHAAGIGEHLQIQLYTIPALQIQFTAPPDQFAPEYPAQTAQNAILKLLTAEIRKRWPSHGQLKFKLQPVQP